VISPHAGYMYSGRVAGAVISRIKMPDTFVIMGPNHTGMGQPYSIMAEGSWLTPLGEVEIDSALAYRVIDSCSYLENDVSAHLEEHSIEVQLPFLQYQKPNVKIVPIVLSKGTGDIFTDIGCGIAKSICDYGGSVAIMASSDMNHYESHRLTEEKDRKAIEAILNLDGEELIKRIAKYNISMCGYAPVVSLIAACKEMGARMVELVMHRTSGDVTGDHRSVVGYAGVLIKGEVI
jgi:AmmeMemoRadiSam system protein B